VNTLEHPRAKRGLDDEDPPLARTSPADAGGSLEQESYRLEGPPCPPERTDAQAGNVGAGADVLDEPITLKARQLAREVGVDESTARTMLDRATHVYAQHARITQFVPLLAYRKAKEELLALAAREPDQDHRS
jgi:hypothetical protein